MDSHLFIQNLELNESLSLPDLGQVVVHSSRSPSKTTDNEDSALVVSVGDGRALLAVADGVGGLPAGEQASKLALEGLRASFQQGVRAGESMREAVLSGLDRANQAVLEKCSGSATTIAALAIDRTRVRAYHVGDSGIVAFGGHGKIKLETIPHSPVGYGVEAGLILAEEALEHEDRHLVSNLVGDSDMHIGISSPLQLRPRDSVVLASDGLFDNLPIESMVDTLRRGALERSVSRVVDECHERMVGGGHADDLTLIVYRPLRAAKSSAA